MEVEAKATPAVIVVAGTSSGVGKTTVAVRMGQILARTVESRRKKETCAEARPGV